MQGGILTHLSDRFVACHRQAAAACSQRSHVSSDAPLAYSVPRWSGLYSHSPCHKPSRRAFKERPAMSSLICRVRKFLRSEDGPTAVEYAVMLALIVIVCLTAIQSIGDNANLAFQKVGTQLQTAAS